jgi:hypothetical protein
MIGSELASGCLADSEHQLAGIYYLALTGHYFYQYCSVLMLILI